MVDGIRNGGYRVQLGNEGATATDVKILMEEAREDLDKNPAGFEFRLKRSGGESFLELRRRKTGFAAKLKEVVWGRSGRNRERKDAVTQIANALGSDVRNRLPMNERGELKTPTRSQARDIVGVVRDESAALSRWKFENDADRIDFYRPKAPAGRAHEGARGIVDEFATLRIYDAETALFRLEDAVRTIRDLDRLGVDYVEIDVEDAGRIIENAFNGEPVSASDGDRILSILHEAERIVDARNAELELMFA